MDEHLRISDAERERAAARLADHYAEGRLSTEEHAERLDAIWTARTGADLAPIFDDLPAQRTPVQRNGPRRRPGHHGLRGLPLLPVIAVLVLLSVVTHLPFWILIFFVVCGGWGRMHRAWR